MYAVFTSKVDYGRKFFESVMFREISDSKAGILVNIGGTIQEVGEKIKKFREYDPEAQLMITKSYDFA
jgi:hypothetical protein